MPAAPNAPRRKVRCPKCTALFPEPAKSVFECPICSSRLSGETQGAALSTIALSGQEKESALRLGNTVNQSNGTSSVKNEEACLRDQDEVADGVSNIKYKEETSLADDSAEGLHDNKEKKSIDRSSIADNAELEGNDTLEKGGSTAKQWDLRLLRTSRCELSFKYSLEGAHGVESEINQKRLLPSKFLLPMSNTEASDVSLHTPLRVRISNRHKESSDHSENGQYSSSSETESHDGSESDFDFPAPWANGAQDKALPYSVHNLSEKEVSAAPHQLELLDAHDASDEGQDGAGESSKHLEEPDIKLSLQDGSRAINPSIKKNEQTEHDEMSSFDLYSQINNLANFTSHAVAFHNDGNPAEDIVTSITLNREDTPVSVPHMQHNSRTGPSSRDVQGLDGCDIDQMGDSKLSNGINASRGDVHSLDWDKQGKVVRPDTESHARDDDRFEYNQAPDVDVELDLYDHQKIAEWNHEQVDDPLSDAHGYESMEHRSHNLDLLQIKAHQNGFSDKAASSGFLPDSPPIKHYFLDDHKISASNSEKMLTDQVPSQSAMLPGQFQLHSMPPHTFHPVPNAYTLCSHHQHPCMPARSGPQCVACRSHSGSLAWNSGPGIQWSCHQPLHGLDPAFSSSQAQCTGGPINRNQLYDFSSADSRKQAYSASNLSRYPPLPKDEAPPYVFCKGCDTVLRLPSILSPTNRFVQKLRCSACRKVNKFCINQYVKQGHEVSNSLLLEMSSIGRVPVPDTLELGQYNSGSLRGSHNQRVLPSSGWQQEENFIKTSCQDDGHVFTSRSGALPLSSQGRDYLTVQMNNLAVDYSMNMRPQFGAKTSNVALNGPPEGGLLRLNHNAEDREQVASVSPIHGTVDEKDEGLDFGAPRISDGESMDPSESRMRSPENMQLPNAFTGVSEANPQNTNLSDDRKQRGPPLLVLMNQESTKFRLSFDPRPLDEEGKGASWSPASDSRLPNFVKRKEQGSSQSRRKGPKYIAGLLRRSLRDLSKGSE